MAASNALDRQVEYGTEITGGYIDHSGEFVIPARFKYADEFLDDLARVCVADKVGHIDRTGTYIIPRDLEVAVRFSEGLAAFRVNGKWGYHDKQGREVVASQFDRAKEFSNGSARVQMRTKKNDGHTNDGYIDESGNYQSAGSPAPTRGC